MVKLTEIINESSGISGDRGSSVPSGNNSARWTPTGQQRKMNIEQLSGYTQLVFPVADSVDISGEPHHWEGQGRTKKYHNKVRAIRSADGSLKLEGSSKLTDILAEIEYDGNLGFHEMFTFYGKANDSQIDKLETLIKNKKFKEAWKFVQRVTGMNLRGSSFN
jgi:hypothetical protein